MLFLNFISFPLQIFTNLKKKIMLFERNVYVADADENSFVTCCK